MKRYEMTFRITWYKKGVEYNKVVKGRCTAVIARQARIPKRIDYRFTELLSKIEI